MEPAVTLHGENKAQLRQAMQIEPGEVRQGHQHFLPFGAETLGQILTNWP
jgi:hypothetical protein